MEAAWQEENHHKNFIESLLNRRLDQLLGNTQRLKDLRHDWEEVKWWQKHCGHLLKERGLDLFDLIQAAERVENVKVV